MAKYEFVDESLYDLEDFVRIHGYERSDFTELFRLFDITFYDGYYLNLLTWDYLTKTNIGTLRTFAGDYTLTAKNSFGGKEITIKKSNSPIVTLKRPKNGSTTINVTTANSGSRIITLAGKNVTIAEVAPNRATKIMTTLLNSKKTATHEEIALFCNSEGKGGIYKGRNNLLYAPRKTGKNHLAYSIAQSDKIKHPLFFLLEDPHGDAERQCRDALGEKVIIVTKATWKKSVEDEKDAHDLEAVSKTVFDRKYPEYRNVKQIQKLVGISDPKELDAVDLFNKILKKNLDTEVDFICLDNLKMLLGSVSNITTQLVDDLISLPSQKHITFLVLHHTKKNTLEIAGAAALEETFDNVYRLTRSETDKSQLTLEETCARYVDEQTVKIARTFNKQGRADHEIRSVEDYHPQQKEKPLNLREKIVALLSDWNESTITFQKLHEIFGGNKGGLTNALIDFGTNPMPGGGTLTISKAGSKNGRETWSVIAINKST